jgi:hypothetical protein
MQFDISQLETTKWLCEITSKKLETFAQSEKVKKDPYLVSEVISLQHMIVLIVESLPKEPEYVPPLKEEMVPVSRLWFTNKQIQYIREKIAGGTTNEYYLEAHKELCRREENALKVERYENDVATQEDIEWIKENRPYLLKDKDIDFGPIDELIASVEGRCDEVDQVVVPLFPCDENVLTTPEEKVMANSKDEIMDGVKYTVAKMEDILKESEDTTKP